MQMLKFPHHAKWLGQCLTFALEGGVVLVRSFPFHCVLGPDLQRGMRSSAESVVDSLPLCKPDSSTQWDGTLWTCSAPPLIAQVEHCRPPYRPGAS